ncbi:hypothetical protein Dimus_016245 [Dionaea muscipula]
MKKRATTGSSCYFGGARRRGSWLAKERNEGEDEKAGGCCPSCLVVDQQGGRIVMVVSVMVACWVVQRVAAGAGGSWLRSLAFSALAFSKSAKNLLALFLSNLACILVITASGIARWDTRVDSEVPCSFCEVNYCGLSVGISSFTYGEL